MKVGMLTGGGDCPGLNAVLRAAVRKAEAHYGDDLVGFRDGWKGVVENLTTELNIERMRGTLPRGGTVLGSSRTNPYKLDGGVDAVRTTLAEQGHRRAHRDRGRGHARCRQPAARRWRRRGGRAEDDRQRPLGDRADLRLQHRGAGLRRRDRPPAHDRRVARPSDGGGGHGSARRPHRVVGGHRGRRHDGVDPREAVRHRRGGRGDHPPSREQEAPRVDRRRRRGRGAEGRHVVDGHRRRRRVRPRAARRHRQRAGDGDRGAHRLRESGGRARPHPARGHAHGVRSCAVDALRHRRDRRRARR